MPGRELWLTLMRAALSSRPADLLIASEALIEAQESLLALLADFFKELDLDLLDLEQPVVLLPQQVVDFSWRCLISNSAFKFTL